MSGEILADESAAKWQNPSKLLMAMVRDTMDSLRPPKGDWAGAFRYLVFLFVLGENLLVKNR